MMVMQALQDKYGFKEGLSIRDGKITEWPYDEKQPTQAELRALAEEYENKTTYQRKRQEEYPPVEEQLDMLYHDKVNGTETWLTTINSIKTKYPKD